MAAYRERVVAGEIAGIGARLRPAGAPRPVIRELKWLKPVYPGDTTAYRSTPREKIELSSKPDWACW